LTDELERQAEEIFAHLDELGQGSILDGVITAVDEGWFQSEIAEASYQFQRKMATRRWNLVGANSFTDGDDDRPPTLYIDPVVEERQLKRLADVKQARDDTAVADALERVRVDAADSSVNIMPALLNAVAAYVTEGEIINALESVFGIWVDTSQP
jgi:methylmalonyl-CoA mutase N-terminal domain/subunit